MTALSPETFGKALTQHQSAHRFAYGWHCSCGKWLAPSVEAEEAQSLLSYHQGRVVWEVLQASTTEEHAVRYTYLDDQTNPQQKYAPQRTEALAKALTEFKRTLPYLEGNEVAKVTRRVTEWVEDDD